MKLFYLIDNCSAHGVNTTLPWLLNVHVEFLPKNTTPILQVLDLEVIACLKNRYKRLLAQRAADLLETEISDNLCKIDLRTAAMRVYDVRSRIQNDIFTIVG